MRDATEGMNGQDLDRRNITVKQAQSYDSGGGTSGDAHVFVLLSRPSPAIFVGRRHQPCCCAATPATVLAPNVESEVTDRTAIRLGLPSKGRIAEETLSLLKVAIVRVTFLSSLSDYTFEEFIIEASQ